MKKLIILLTFFSFLTIGISNTAKAEEEQEPCRTVSETCPNGVTYMAIVCDHGDYMFYDDYFCGLTPE